MVTSTSPAPTMYLGVNFFSIIDSDSSRTEALFAMTRRLAPRAKLLTVRLPGRRRPSHGGASDVDAHSD
ncbi:hypothetical protein GCM10010430_78100 [Kitasatospora cystarginea]|uniref:Uncharacterized protein n=1 Tax=Kitasatospora cystarginea TaxID=58350 RepID=A0ABP5RXQ9_9ACTN